MPAEIASKPTRLQFQFGQGALRREKRAFMDARGFAKLCITVSKQHGGIVMLETLLRFGDNKILAGNRSAASEVVAGRFNF